LTGSRVSVVIPTYNASRFIRRTLDSVLAQRGMSGRLDIVVVDDGSGDDTVEIVRRIPSGDIRIDVLQGARRGVCAARNAGVARCRGEHVAFLDHDDLWEPDKLKRQADLLDADPRAALVFTQARVMAERPGDPEGEITETFPMLREPESFLARAYENLVHWNYIPMSAVMVRRSALPEPAFDPRFQLAEDWDLWLRIAASAGPGGVRFIAEPLTAYRIVAGRATERMADLRLEDISIFQREIERHPWLADSDPGRCRDTLYRLHEEAGYWLLREGRRAEARRMLRAAWRIKPSSLKPLGRLLASLVPGRAGETGACA